MVVAALIIWWPVAAFAYKGIVNQAKQPGHGTAIAWYAFVGLFPLFVAVLVALRRKAIQRREARYDDGYPAAPAYVRVDPGRRSTSHDGTATPPVRTVVGPAPVAVRSEPSSVVQSAAKGAMITAGIMLAIAGLILGIWIAFAMSSGQLFVD